MKKFLPLVLLLAFAAPNAHAETIERIVAIAGDDIITMQDLREEGQIRYATQGKDLAVIDESPFREKLLMELAKELVQARLVAKEAARLQVPVGEAEVNRQLQEMYKQSGQSEADYKQYLEESGMSWAAFRKYLKGELQTQYVLRAELAGQVQVPEADVVSCAQAKSPQGEASGVEVGISQILLREPENDSAQGLGAPVASQLNAPWWNAVDAARMVVARGIQEELTQRPEWFSEAVKTFSSGSSAQREGLLGSFAPGDLSQEFNTIFTLQPGQFSGVISTSAGLHIMRVNEVIQGESSAWKNTLEACRNELMQAESNRLIQSWFNNLIENNFVSFKLMDDISEP